MRHPVESGRFGMITTYRAAMEECEKHRECDGFCSRNCSCSGLSIGGATQSVHDAASEEANSAGLTRYNILSGKCGDWYIVKIDEMGRLI